MPDPIVVVAYNPIWPVRFRIEAQLLRLALLALKPAIEHIGSTSVPGLAAKPVIDMLVGVSSLEAFEAFADRVSNYGYEYIPEYEQALPDRRFFKRVVGGVRTHHLHVVEVNGLCWKRYVKFRNHLRADASLAARYAEVKRRLAGRFPNDRDAYTNGKTGFVEGVLAKPSPRDSWAEISAPAESQAA
ncbi:MAG: GrpB family protein [Burkholderiaceae bacterium]